MTQIGRLVATWRYPVKGMRGEATDELFLSFSGVYGDRVFAFRSAGAPPGFPYHTAREQEDLLLYQPRFRHAAGSKRPPNLEEADAMAPGITPVIAERDAFAVDVLTPDGREIPIEDLGLLETVAESRDDGAGASLVYSDRPMTDCRPLSIFALSTGQQIGTELGYDIDHRRFRANLYIELDAAGAGPLREKDLVGRTIKVGDKATVAILERDPRCKMIALDPETGEHDPKILQQVAQSHEGFAGLYAAVLVEGVVRPGDALALT